MLLLLPLAFGAFIGGAYGFYYRGTYDAPDAPKLGLEEITVPTPAVQSFREALPQRQGVFLLDKGHLNRFDDDQITRLLTRVSETGYRVEILERAFSSSTLDNALRAADVFAVVVPGDDYNEEEVKRVYWQGRETAIGG